MDLSKGRLLSPLFPSECACCGMPVEGGTLICEECREGLLSPEPPLCPFCGAGVSRCGCRGNTPYDILVSPFYYKGPVKDGIRRIKFLRREDSAVFFGREMGRTVNERLFGYEFDILAPVPASREKLMERGFNQSLSMAEEMRIENGKKRPVLDPGLLKKREGTEIKREKTRSGRKELVKGSFVLGRGRNVSGKRILLVDDILTTGATAGECATVLKLQGASFVAVVCAAVPFRDL